jgi:hypothetical protein
MPWRATVRGKVAVLAEELVWEVFKETTISKVPMAMLMKMQWTVSCTRMETHVLMNLK